MHVERTFRKIQIRKRHPLPHHNLYRTYLVLAEEVDRHKQNRMLVEHQVANLRNLVVDNLI